MNFWFIKPWIYDSEHDLGRATKSCYVLLCNAGSIELYILAYSL